MRPGFKKPAPVWLMRWVSGCLILVLLFSMAAQTQGVEAQVNDPNAQAQALLETMSPEQKVGQLFLVTFRGTDATRESQIYKLVADHYVGGVILRADNDNFTGPGTTVPKAAELIRALQTHVWDAAQRSIAATGSQDAVSYIPLFIGLSQEGDLFPHDQILSGMTSLPSPMAIGATWRPELAETIGTILGRELRAMGFNLYLGPSLDVLEVISSGGSDLGTRTFGGDPYWVGEMGKAYIRGLHTGSREQVAVIAKHFPGRGGSDRLPEEEVATVRKSLEALKQVELAPFFSMMTASRESLSRADGVLVSHIRYQGLQENIREITPPVSLDAEAMKQVLTLEPTAQWYQEGGLVVSDNLGSNAVRRFYDPTGQTFDARMVARSAFLAGNDLLYVNNFIDTADSDSYTTIVRTLESFAQKYREDPAFAERVDSSVRRILVQKFRQYGDLRIDRVVPNTGLLVEVGRSQAVVLEVARQSVTLISPTSAELSGIIPRPPETRDQIVFFTDVITSRQCSTCAEQSFLSAETLKNAVVRLYGPAAGGPIVEGFLSTYTFLELSTYINNPEGLAALGANLSEAEWVVFSLTSESPTRPESRALRRLLSERPELIRNKKVIVFAFGAPYYLDATDIAKLTAYYGLYSKASAYIDTAARVLFQEQTHNGFSPVSIPGIGYDIIRVTSPEPSQVIPLLFDLPEPEPVEEGTATPELPGLPEYKTGDLIPLKTGLIYDQNRNPVPDSTIVRFIITNLGEGGTSQQIETVTSGGVARASYRITSPANIEIRVVSEPAMVSQIININVSNGSAAISTSVPTQEPTQTQTPTATATVTPTMTPTPEPEAAYEPGLSEWFFAILLIWGSSALIAWVGQRKVSLRWGVRWGLLAAVGGMLAYIYLKSGWFGAINQFLTGKTWGVLLVSMVGVLAGWLIGWLWHWRLQSQKKQRRSSETR